LASGDLVGVMVIKKSAKNNASKQLHYEHHKSAPESDGGELRQDLITGKWIVLATTRAKRPDDFIGERSQPTALAKVDNDCPFCRLDKFVQEPDVVRLPDDPDKWQVHIFPNKYPAFCREDDLRTWQVGPYRAMESVGYHEVLATRWHNEIDSRLSTRQLSLQLEALVLRYRQLKEKPAVNYIQIIKNHGKEAGASLQHPHHQIFTVPVLPSDIRDMLEGAHRYRESHEIDPFEAMVRFEEESGDRIVAENDHFVAFCPYASRVPFETWVVPREHNPFFENVGPEQRTALAEILSVVFKQLYIGLNDPPYNYYILSAPCDDTGFVCDRVMFDNFRWHLQILPRLNVWGGFEMGTGLEIVTTAPEESARHLRGQVIEQ